MVVQTCVLLLCLLLFRESFATEDHFRFKQNVILRDKVCTGIEKNTNIEKSRMRCAMACAKQSWCSYFFYTPSTGECSMPVEFPRWTVPSSSPTQFYELDVDCPVHDGFIYVPAARYCFKIFLDIVSDWDAAIVACQEKGLQLAILNTDLKMSTVIQTILDSTSYTSPVGVDYCLAGSIPRSQWDVDTSTPYTNFFWTDGTPVVTSYWGSNQPGGKGEDHVLSLYSPTYLVYDRPYNEDYRYICQKDL